tara:strand:- start:82 stop:1896 length:1815 start_codon:yes stop_codon:yes gene_type:complete
MKVYKLIILFCFFSFIIYYNFLNPEQRANKTVSQLIAKITKPGCTDISALNYNAEAIIDDGSCDLDCFSQEIEDYCLCSRREQSLDCNLEYTKIDSKISLEQIRGDRLSGDIKFNELIYSAYSDYYYSKLTQISQVAFLDYVYANLSEDENIEDYNYPHVLFYLAIEFINMSDYSSANKVLDRFLNTKSDYNNNPDYFYKFDGCCPADLDWVKNEFHKSYEIAKIMKEIISGMHTGMEYDFNILTLSDQFEKLKQFDQTPNTIDLIENIIFSILFSVRTESESIIAYKLDFLENQIGGYEDIQIGPLYEPFEKIYGKYYLSSQVDIISILKFNEAKKYIDDIKNNHHLNSLYDIEALIRYDFLETNYIGNQNSDLKNMIMGENKRINDKYTQYYQNQLNTTSSEDNIFGDDFDFESDINTNLDDGKALKILDKYCSQNRANQIVSEWNSQNNLNQNISDSMLFFMGIRDNIDYGVYIGAIDSMTNTQRYPIFKKEFRDYLSDQIDSNLYRLAKDNYTDVPYYVSDKIPEYKMYKNDIYILELFNMLINLKFPSMPEDMKAEIKKIFNKTKTSNNSDFAQKDIEFGHYILLASISNWSMEFEGLK